MILGPVTMKSAVNSDSLYLIRGSGKRIRGYTSCIYIYNSETGKSQLIRGGSEDLASSFSFEKDLLSRSLPL